MALVETNVPTNLTADSQVQFASGLSPWLRAALTSERGQGVPFPTNVIMQALQPGSIYFAAWSSVDRVACAFDRLQGSNVVPEAGQLHIFDFLDWVASGKLEDAKARAIAPCAGWRTDDFLAYRADIIPVARILRGLRGSLPRRSTPLTDQRPPSAVAKDSLERFALSRPAGSAVFDLQAAMLALEVARMYGGDQDLRSYHRDWMLAHVGEWVELQVAAVMAPWEHHPRP